MEWTRILLEKAWITTRSVVVREICEAWGPTGDEAHRGRMFPVSLLPSQTISRIDAVRTASWGIAALEHALDSRMPLATARQAARLEPETDGYEYVATPYTTPTVVGDGGDESVSDDGDMPELANIHSGDVGGEGPFGGSVSPPPTLSVGIQEVERPYEQRAEHEGSET